LGGWKCYASGFDSPAASLDGLSEQPASRMLKKEGWGSWDDPLARGTEEGMEADDLLCSRNALGLVCLVGWSFWSIWFFRMNFQCDQPD
jgi:hypothetical protein